MSVCRKVPKMEGKIASFYAQGGILAHLVCAMACFLVAATNLRIRMKALSYGNRHGL